MRSHPGAIARPNSQRNDNRTATRNSGKQTPPPPPPPNPKKNSFLYPLFLFLFSSIFFWFLVFIFFLFLLILYINSLRPCVCPSDMTILRFNSPAEPACIFYGRTGSAGELKCKGRFSSPTLLLLLLRRLPSGQPDLARHPPRRATNRLDTLWGLGNFRIWISGHGFQDLGSQLWGLGNFRIWFSGHGFQDLGSQLWGLDFHTCGFQDRNLNTFKM